MKIWLDAQLSPAIAKWMEEAFDISEAFPVQADSAMRATEDFEIFRRAREAKL